VLGVFKDSTKWLGQNAGLPPARSMMRHSTHRRSGAASLKLMAISR
tara:strand:- start:139 stop:276 length:138 start_codon:yes stop_codon:yes gene_type:complete